MPEKLKNLLDSELERAMGLLSDTDPRTEEYGRLLYALNEISYRLQSCNLNAEHYIPREPAEEPKPTTVEDPPSHSPSPAPAPVVETADDGEYINPEELRAYLAEAKKKGVVIADLIVSLGAANFSGLRDDQTKLRQLRDMVNKALEEL